jgi:hypothetical protein
MVILVGLENGVPRGGPSLLGCASGGFPRARRARFSCVAKLPAVAAWAVTRGQARRAEARP